MHAQRTNRRFATEQSVQRGPFRRHEDWTPEPHMTESASVASTRPRDKPKRPDVDGMSAETYDALVRAETSRYEGKWGKTK